MTELEVKLVKVDNWGIFFLQRLKHFFNRTDYCDLTLQFQDNAQLKVHRLVLSACTEYFELLERTCEMYEDCLVMPDDLQADVVVPIVNFMYTGQLEFRMDLLERLYQTSQIMNMPVLTKLLDAHRNQAVITPVKTALTYNNNKRSYSKPKEFTSRSKQAPVVSSTNPSPRKRPYLKAFGNAVSSQIESKKTSVIHKPESINSSNSVPTPYLSPNSNSSSTTASRKSVLGEPRPTRYELPEELDTDNIFDSSFTNISYTSQPLMVHPEATKQYQRKSNLFGEASGSRKLGGGTSTLDIVECKKVPKKESIYEDHDQSEIMNDLEMFQIKDEASHNISNQLFDQIIDQPTGPKVTIETKDTKQANNIDHAKIISEVLKKYPHLVKSNKNIKLKILNSPTTTPTVNKPKAKKQKRNLLTSYIQEKEVLGSESSSDCTFETDVLDSKEAARLIALGADNVKGPWICLICGTPGRALHFRSYFNFRRHLVQVHNEKPVSNMCEYCGLKSLKRNYLLHHLLTKHGVEPPPQYTFPKCNVCSYIALTEGLLTKHKLTHTENRTFRCNVCPASYYTSSQLLAHIQNTGHKYCADRKTNLQCVYCLKVFLREGNLYAHLKTYHKQAAKSDGIIDDSDEENVKQEESTMIKYEPQNYETEYEDVGTQYQIRPDGNIELVTKKQRPLTTPNSKRQKILNSVLEVPVAKPAQQVKSPVKNVVPVQKEETEEETVMIDNMEYIIRNNQLVPKKKGGHTYEMILPDNSEELTPSTSLDYSNMQESIIEEDLHDQKMVMKKTSNINQPIQIVVSNEEEYKALMSSNHSIIFDDGDANKTLTVLNNANTAMNTLDLDTAQTNNMMLIPDNYPISVSESLPGNNPNIVVVYSHAMDDQSKQYQLITSQGIDAQFVQSSAVITQNFAAPAASATVMTAPQVIDSQIPESWQNSVHDNETAQLTELSEMAIIERTEIIPMEQPEIAPAISTDITNGAVTEMTLGTDNEITSLENTELPSVHPSTENIDSELPDVTLTTDSEVIQEVSEATGEDNIDEDIVQQHNENDSTLPECVTLADTVSDDSEKVDEENVASTIPSDVDISTESATDNTEYIVSTVSLIETTTSEHLPENSTNTAIEESIINEIEPPEIIEENTDTNVIEQNVLTNESQVDQSSEVTENETADVEEEHSTIIQDTAIKPVNKLTIPEETKEQIQSLTSEWSEDEYDTEAQEQTDENIEKDAQENETISQVEESVENIQQEMDNQMSEVSETVDTEESVNENLPEETASVTLVEPPQAKISSLLNDWDENDSQEGIDTTNGTEDESVPTETARVVNELEKAKEITVLEKTVTKTDDKIQSLVSDWDDEEDDSKNEDVSA